MNAAYSQEAQDAATAHITNLVNAHVSQLGGKVEGVYGSQLVCGATEVAGAAQRIGGMLRKVASRMTPGDKPTVRVWAQRVPGNADHTMVAGYVIRKATA